MSFSQVAQKQLNESLELLKIILGPDLLGVYLFGSSTIGGLQKYSDIDLFVVHDFMKAMLHDLHRLATNWILQTRTSVSN